MKLILGFIVAICASSGMAGTCVCQGGASGTGADPLKLILPRPQVVETGAGTVSGSALARVTVEKEPVRGAPAAVACEAYALV